MSENVKVGHFLKGTEHRDAIHVALIPVVAGENLNPGQHVGVIEHGSKAVISDKPVGIVDPFLKMPVPAGEIVYLFLYPQTVTGMRHHWFHPEFDITDKPISKEEEIAAAKKWIQDYVMKHCPYWAAEYGAEEAYNSFMSHITTWNEIFYYGSDLHGYFELEEPDELFQNLSIVLGRWVGPDTFTYSCSC